MTLPSGSRLSSEIDLSDSDFTRIAAKIHTINGIVLQDHKKVMVKTRVLKRLHANGFSDFSSYLDFLDTSKGAEEITEFCNSLTTNLTSFFREVHHFEHLAKELDELASRNKKRVRLWSAGCSTGEEPYSMAMTVRSCKRFDSQADIKILATDIDTGVLATAARGEYDSANVKDLPSFVSRDSVGAVAGSTIEIPQRIKSLIAFRRLNLLERWPFDGPFDIIFCRNVVIYFDAKTKADVIDRLSKKLAPGGVLYLGHSETILGGHADLLSDGKTTYRRRS